MAYDSELAERVLEILEEEFPLFHEKKMFGGWACMIQGNLACGVLEDGLIVRVGKEAYETDRLKEGVREFDFTGKPMVGWIVVEGEDLENEETLRDWILKGINFALSLPAKN